MPATVGKAGSTPHSALRAKGRCEFPVAPNIDAGKGVSVMFAEMKIVVAHASLSGTLAAQLKIWQERDKPVRLLQVERLAADLTRTRPS